MKEEPCFRESQYPDPDQTQQSEQTSKHKRQTKTTSKLCPRYEKLLSVSGILKAGHCHLRYGLVDESGVIKAEAIHIFL